MGMPSKKTWLRILNIGKGAAALFIPAVATGIDLVEAGVSGLKDKEGPISGPEKRAEAKKIAKGLVLGYEAIKHVDLDDAQVEVATDEFIDSYVELSNFEAMYEEAKTRLQNAKAKLVSALDHIKASDDASSGQ